MAENVFAKSAYILAIIKTIPYFCNNFKPFMLMRVGFRTPSWKRSLSARTKGRFTRSVKRAVIPGYGRRGMGILHPKRAVYNQVYRRTTFGLGDILKALFK